MKDLFDILKSVAVLLILVACVMVLPFFLAGAITIFVVYVIYLIVRAMRLKKEKEKANAEEKRNAARANAGS